MRRSYTNRLEMDLNNLWLDYTMLSDSKKKRKLQTTRNHDDTYSNNNWDSGLKTFCGKNEDLIENSKWYLNNPVTKFEVKKFMSQIAHTKNPKHSFLFNENLLIFHSKKKNSRVNAVNVI